ncbi:putative membrane protein [Chitinivorax tropicus]|uniref:Putative membrane protein n=1 Tax=Chitinivorax tropicus TaxID=714531 RepID=A0A840MML7_9PROT|nr:putative membrane protein [Chitinivorax tropicus]
MLRNVLIGLITLLYPFAVWLGQAHVEPRVLALLLVAVLALRVKGSGLLAGKGWLLAAGTLLVTVLISNSALPLKLYPVLVNLAMLAVFGWSLRHPPTVIERLARLREPDLPESGVQYTRKVTQVWCGFFVVNGAIALGTALWASPAVWSLYNGLIAYLLMGVLFAIEFCVRWHVKRKHHV